MIDIAINPATDTQSIVVDEVFPHAPEVVWKAITSGDLIARWLMVPTGFAAVEGTDFTLQTTPAGAWDGIIRCRVLEVAPPRRFAFSWQGGDAGNVGYGSALDTVAAFTLTPEAGGTRLRVIHSGFRLPHNESAFRSMSEGWKTVVGRLGEIAGELNGGAKHGA